MIIASSQRESTSNLGPKKASENVNVLKNVETTTTTIRTFKKKIKPEMILLKMSFQRMMILSLSMSQLVTMAALKMKMFLPCSQDKAARRTELCLPTQQQARP